MRKTHNLKIIGDKDLTSNQILVFGSNTQGKHDKGLALIAKESYGAAYGQSMGLQGQSYAIITKDLTRSIQPSISKDFIIGQIKQLYIFAKIMPKLEFIVPYTLDGKNLNNYTGGDMIEMFKIAGIDNNKLNIPDNIIFEEEFNNFIFSNQ